MLNLDSEKLDTLQSNLLQNTSYYIEYYLKPTRKWDRNTNGRQRIDLIRNANVNWDIVFNHIRSMNYLDFLATPYWKAVAAHTKYKSGYRCLLCPNRTDLVTHHRDYSIHGREHAQIEELVVLCRNCHQKFHGHQEESLLSCNDVIDNVRVSRFVIVFLLIIAGMIMYLSILPVTSLEIKQKSCLEIKQKSWWERVLDVF